MAGLRSRHKAETRAALLSATKAIVLDGSELTARSIAARADLSTGAIFGHWNRIWEMLVEAAQDPAVRDKLVATRSAEIRELMGPAADPDPSLAAAGAAHMDPPPAATMLEQEVGFQIWRFDRAFEGYSGNSLSPAAFRSLAPDQIAFHSMRGRAAIAAALGA